MLEGFCKCNLQMARAHQDDWITGERKISKFQNMCILPLFLQIDRGFAQASVVVLAKEQGLENMVLRYNNCRNAVMINP